MVHISVVITGVGRASITSNPVYLNLLLRSGRLFFVYSQVPSCITITVSLYSQGHRDPVEDGQVQSALGRHYRDGSGTGEAREREARRRGQRSAAPLTGLASLVSLMHINSSPVRYSTDSPKPLVRLSCSLLRHPSASQGHLHTIYPT